jgi:hypothetical protein
VSRVCFRSDDIAIFDDVLDDADFQFLTDYLNDIDYRSVHRDHWVKAWRLHDGNPLRSSTIWYDPRREECTLRAVFPTSSPVDALVRWVLAELPNLENVVGIAEVDWQRLSLTPWIYPPGSGLSLHHDGFRYSGAFAYFAHREWHLHWGGHLLALDPRTVRPASERVPERLPFLTDNDDAALEPGLMLGVLAKPNRIVFLSPKAQHLVSRVDTNAGQFARLSIAGFFQKRAN